MRWVDKIFFMNLLDFSFYLYNLLIKCIYYNDFYYLVRKKNVF